MTTLPFLAVWLLAAITGCTTAAQSVRVTPLAGQSAERMNADIAECDASARKEARYRPVRPAGENVLRSTPSKPADEVVGSGNTVGGALRGDTGFAVGGRLGVAFGDGPERDLYEKLYARCMVQRGYQPVEKSTGR